MDEGTPCRREQIATRVVFLVVGVLISAWAPMVPVVRARLGLDDAQLGALLFCVGLGSVTTMPFSGGLAARLGCRRVILAAGTIACVALPVMAIAPSSSVLGASLYFFGAGIGTCDVVMNIQAVVVEKASGRAMMSGFHGLFSVGGIAGAGLVTGFWALGMALAPSALVVALLAAVSLCGVAKGLLPYGSEEESPVWALPRGKVLLLGALCFAMFLAEGSVLDWSGVLLNTVRGLERDRSGLAYVAFSVTMTLGRLTGDVAVRKLGPVPILVTGGLLSALGFALAALAPLWAVTVLGFALVGAGAANAVPVLFSAAGRQRSMPSNLAVAAVTTMGYAGVLAGPALIGFLARWLTLPSAMLFVAALLVGVASCARSAAVAP